jgi:DNA-binding XRE family transcriptional regulator
MTTHNPIDFNKVESLRRHMLLTVRDMTTLLGVSRMTYYGWVRGQVPRSSTQAKVRIMLKRLLSVMTEHGWPMPEVIAATQPERMAMLRQLLDEQNLSGG